MYHLVKALGPSEVLPQVVYAVVGTLIGFRGSTWAKRVRTAPLPSSLFCRPKHYCDGGAGQLSAQSWPGKGLMGGAVVFPTAPPYSFEALAKL